MGVRQRQAVFDRRRERTARRRRCGADGTCGDRWHWTGVHVGRSRGAAPGEWSTYPGARRLVPAVPRLLSVLPESPAATCGALGSHRNASTLNGGVRLAQILDILDSVVLLAIFGAALRG